MKKLSASKLSFKFSIMMLTNEILNLARSEICCLANLEIRVDEE